MNKGEGDKVESPETIREVISKKTSSFISHALVTVLSDQGTAALARVNGFTAAGKTGTAQKISPHGGYLENRYIVSFAGYLPVENPRLVGLVIVDDAPLSESMNYGGAVAGPVFSQIAGQAARHLDLEPEAGSELMQSASSGSKSASLR
jgi:cell division protein FtsI/penicillin-binding protein 2